MPVLPTICTISGMLALFWRYFAAFGIGVPRAMAATGTFAFRLLVALAKR